MNQAQLESVGHEVVGRVGIVDLRLENTDRLRDD